MSDMTDEDVMALADDCILAAKCMEDTGAFPTGQAVLRDAARALLDARAELAQARADAKVAVAVEKAVAVAEVYSDAEVMGRITGDTEIADAISALASEDAIAEVAKLRAERDAALADVARFQEERTYVIGANDGWDAAVEQGEASPAVEKAMVRFWKKLAETHNERADRLAAELASANAREAGLREASALLRGHAGAAASLLRKFGISESVAEFLEAAVAEHDAALAQPSTEVATKPDLCNKNGREGDQT